MENKIRLSDTVMKELEAIILNMKPGDKLPTEMELAERFSVGRSTIRECMKVFSARKMIVRRNEGTFVSSQVKECLVDPLNILVSMDIGNLTELIELREILETEAVKLAVQRATDEEIKAIERADWRMDEPGISPDEMQSRDFEFHNALAMASGNSILTELIKAIRKVIAGKLEDSTEALPISGEGSLLHKKIIGAVKERNLEEALEAMEEYLIITDYKA